MYHWIVKIWTARINKKFFLYFLWRSFTGYDWQQWLRDLKIWLEVFLSIVNNWELLRANFLSKTGQISNTYKGFLSKVGQSSNSQTGNHSILKEHAHTSMLTLHCSDESQYLGTIEQNEWGNFDVSHPATINCCLNFILKFLKIFPQNFPQFYISFNVLN